LEAPSFFHDLLKERPEEKILFHIQKSIPRQKGKRNTAKDFSGGRIAGTEWRRKEALGEHHRERQCVRGSIASPRAPRG
tara:strand:+ start:4291 stop:4527 length:237 start_codon:yes stop_codon:yes gene_type:complete